MPETTTTTEATSALRLALAVLPKPDHTGQIESGPPWHAVPLDRNYCSCDLHKAHVAVRAAIVAGETKGEPVDDCGCNLIRVPTGLHMESCPVHEAAPDMLEALRPFANFACDEPHVGEPECHNCIARAAIALATKEAE